MNEESIRPQRLFSKYLDLARDDALTLFSPDDLSSIVCPACGSSTSKHEFDKHRFPYASCNSCFTLFANPRHSLESFQRYYTSSKSSSFWATDFYKETQEARTELLWRPKAKSILRYLDEHQASFQNVVDIGGGYGLFAQTYYQLTGTKPLVIEPSPVMADVCRNRGLNVLQCFFEDIQPCDLPTGPTLFLSFELVEHLHDPFKFFLYLSRLMKPGDSFIFTTLSSLGLDILTLWQDSDAVSPPHHLNFFNPQSITLLLDRVGLTTSSVSTPGLLDIDILLRSKQLIKNRVVYNQLVHSTREQLDNWQLFLQKNLTSSHMRVICSK